MHVRSVLFILTGLWMSTAHGQIYHCPPGSTQVSGGGGIMCRCPDGSFAAASGCRQQPVPRAPTFDPDARLNPETLGHRLTAEH